MQGFAIWRLKPGSNQQYEQYGFAQISSNELECFSQIGQFFTSPNDLGVFLPPSEVNHLQCTEWGLEERPPSQAEAARDRSAADLAAAAAEIVAA